MSVKNRIRAIATVIVVVGLLIPMGSALALFTNGSFEAGDFSSWTQTNFLNYGLTGSPPFDGTDIVRTAGGSNQSIIVGPATPLSQPDSVLGASASLRWPRFGSYAARVNGPAINRISNTLFQSSIVTASDVDTVDGMVHIRFALAPVLQDPGHAANEQPFFYVVMRNVTQGNALLYETFNYANQPGVPWITITVGGQLYRYTDWQVVDIAPGNVALAVGDTVSLEVIAADCSLSGHAGWVYVDAFGSQIPGLSVVKTAPAQVNPGANLTYDFTYRNTGETAISSVIVTETLPLQTTYVSVSDPVNCSEAGGVVTCNFGTLNPGDSGTFQVTVLVASGATGTINNGNYSIAGTAYPAILGPLVTTTVSAAPLADLSITKSDGLTSVSRGQGITYSIVALNSGPSAVSNATVTDTMPASLTGVSWTCLASAGSSCTASGSGNINDGTVSLPVGGSVTYTVTGTVATGASGNLSNIATIAVPAGVTESDPSDNSVIDTDTITANSVPSVSDVTKVEAAGAVLHFTPGDFTAHFSDPEGDSLARIRVTSLPAHGTLRLSGVLVTVNQEILASDLGNLTFTPDPGWSGSTSFGWNGSDGTTYAAVAAAVDITILGPGASLPATGFAPGRLTLLPEQPLDSAYSGLGDLLLEIPRLDLQTTIVGIPWGDAGWDVTWLWERVGYLEGTAFPTWPGNTVLTGHVSLPDGSVGPFAGLRDLVWGDEIHIHGWGSQYTYEVRQVRLVSPNSAWPYRHEDLDWVTLVTCQGFDEEHGTYRSRLVIRAVLMEVGPED